MNNDHVWEAWPVCPGCGRLRQTVCPTCGNAGNEFQLADYQAVAEPQRATRTTTSKDLSEGASYRVLLMCSHCDEAFLPRFYRTCPACGCDGGDGIEANRHSGEQISSRTLLAIYGLIALLASTLFYFWILFRD